MTLLEADILRAAERLACAEFEAFQLEYRVEPFHDDRAARRLRRVVGHHPAWALRPRGSITSRC